MNTGDIFGKDRRRLLQYFSSSLINGQPAYYYHILCLSFRFDKGLFKYNVKKEPKDVRMISVELLLRQKFRKRGSAPRGRPRALTVRRTFSGPRYGRLSCPDSKRRFCRIRAPRRLTLTVRRIRCTESMSHLAFFENNSTAPARRIDKK